MEISKEEDSKQDSVRAVDRALDILLAFRPGENRLSAGDLLKRVDLSVPPFTDYFVRLNCEASSQRPENPSALAWVLQ